MSTYRVLDTQSTSESDLTRIEIKTGHTVREVVLNSNSDGTDFLITVEFGRMKIIRLRETNEAWIDEMIAWLVENM